MTIKEKEIETILTGKFADEADREYWVKKLQELKRKEATAKQNAEYFKKMRVYDR